MSIIASSISIHAKFVCNLKENKARTNVSDREWDKPQKHNVADAADKPQANRKHASRQRSSKQSPSLVSGK